MELADMIAAVEPDFNAERNLLGSVWNGPGYHSRVPNGSWVHQTRCRSTTRWRCSTTAGRSISNAPQR